MAADRDIVDLLKEIRDLMQVLVVRQGIASGSPLVDLTNTSERHGRSWSLLAHREPLQLEEESGDSPLM
ncbi:MAG: hypothetical protein ACREJU_19355 [Nitrospiraceae bacterium]